MAKHFPWVFKPMHYFILLFIASLSLSADDVYILEKSIHVLPEAKNFRKDEVLPASTGGRLSVLRRVANHDPSWWPDGIAIEIVSLNGQEQRPVRVVYIAKKWFERATRSGDLTQLPNPQAIQQQALRTLTPVLPSCEIGVNEPVRESNEEQEEIDTTQTVTAEDSQASHESLTTTANTFNDEDEFFRSITTEPPQQCGYKLKGFSRAEVRKICRAMDAIAKDQPIKQEDLCHVSNCVTAPYLAVIKIAKTRPDWDNIKSRFTCSSPFPRSYLMFGGPNGLRAFTAEYELGESRRLVLGGSAHRRSEKLKADYAAGWPRKNDPIFLQRDVSKRRTAHTAIFSHYQTASGEDYDPNNPQKISKVCYWSSNSGTRGPSNRCEPISYLSFIDAAQIK